MKFIRSDIDQPVLKGVRETLRALRRYEVMKFGMISEKDQKLVKTTSKGVPQKCFACGVPARVVDGSMANGVIRYRFNSRVFFCWNCIPANPRDMRNRPRKHLP